MALETRTLSSSPGRVCVFVELILLGEQTVAKSVGRKKCDSSRGSTEADEAAMWWLVESRRCVGRQLRELIAQPRVALDLLRLPQVD